MTKSNKSKDPSNETTKRETRGSKCKKGANDTPPPTKELRRRKRNKKEDIDEKTTLNDAPPIDIPSRAAHKIESNRNEISTISITST